MGMISDWPSMAACQSGDPDALFVQGAEQNVATRICRSCPVRYESPADAPESLAWRVILCPHPAMQPWRMGQPPKTGITEPGYRESGTPVLPFFVAD